jgi:plasmid stabilization system protein ParE
MTIEILDQAQFDLLEGFHFYEDREAGLGSYFLTNLFADIESLRLHAGVHRKAHKQYHRLLSKRFPFAVFYTIENDRVRIHAVLDCRKDPAWIRRRIS